MLYSVTRKHTWAIAPLVGLFTLFVASGSQASAASARSLTRKEAKALAITAKTPEDHMHLARYFNSEADRLEAESKAHQELAETYRHSPISTLMAVKNPVGPRTARHCDSLARYLKEKAQSARESAAMHEQMAKDALANPN